MQTLLKMVLSFLVFGVVTVSTARADNGYVYAVGQGDSDSLRVSMEKAKLDGEFGLAEQTKGKPVGYCEVVKQEIKPVDGKFHTYVLLRIAVR